MGYASQAGRARTSTSNPQAHAICDRCGFRYNHVDLQWQFDWAGASLINKRILVCNTCNDKPQQQLRAINLPADPMPIMNPRTQNFPNATTDYLASNTNYFTILSAVGTGSVVTLTLEAPAGIAAIAVGSWIIVSGVEPARYNGTYKVTGSSTGPYTVSFASSATGDLTVGGTLARNVDPITGLVRVQSQQTVTPEGDFLVSQATGAAPGSLNETPGVPPDFPTELGGDDPGLPYGYTTIPSTGPLE